MHITNRLYPITIDLSELTDDMITWAENQSAQVYKENNKTYIKFKNSKTCHYLAGSKSVRLHMDQSIKDVAFLFLMTFQPYIIKQNLMEQYDKQTN